MQEFLPKNFLINNLNESKFIPGLYVVATPIGNLLDITLRALETLSRADFIICEDSRTTNHLLSKFQIKKSFIIYNDHSDQVTRDKILALIKSGKILALVSDAGTPLVCDPGYKLVSFLLEHDAKVIAIPGPSSLISALSISGIESDRFLFAGFIPASEISRTKFLSELSNINSTLIFFETANRISKTIDSMFKTFGNRTAAVVREMTKIYEETRKDYLENLAKYYQENNIKGEVVILVSPPKSQNEEIDFEVIDREIKLGLKKMKPKELIALISEQYGLSKKELYQRMLKILDEK